MTLQWVHLGGKLKAAMTFRPKLLGSFTIMLLLVLPACGLQRSSDSMDPRQRAHADAIASDESAAASNAGNADVERRAAKARRKSSLVNSALEYDFDRPDLKWLLPDTLREISDVAVLSESEVACVQDERGIVYIYNTKLKRITDEVRFGSKGDYEGLTIVDSKLFVLRSDGLLFELSSLKQHPPVQTYKLNLPSTESEGLCLDAKRNRLLIAPKDHEQSGKSKDLRPIYAFDLSKRALAADPAFELSLREIRRFAKQNDLPVPRRVKKNGESLHSSLRFKPSAIAVHPATGEVFILSSADHVIVSCTETGSITGYALLDATLYPQPEGIAFFANGDMLISNEAAGKQATLFTLRRKH